MEKRVKKTAIAAAVSALVATGTGAAHGAGFALIETNASGMGNAYAGAAAVAEDASTIYFNPAGMTHLSGTQAAFALHLIDVSTKFSDSGTSTAPFTIPTLGGNGGDAGDQAVVPNAYFSMPVSEQLTFGVGLNAPFGLATEYDATWLGRFQGIKSEIVTVNVNPSIAFKVNETISLGLGINYQQIEAELTNKVNGVGINVAFAGQEFDGKIEGDDDGWGWNAGVLFNIADSTRVGVAYRSTIDYTMEGNLSVRNGATALVNTAVTADITMPDSMSLSVASNVGERVQLLADVTRTNWSEIRNLRVVDTTGTERENLVLDLEDATRWSVGINYSYSDAIVLKAGVALDESPVTDANRTVRLPDADRTWLSVGAKFRIGPGALDVGYSHLKVDDAPINQDRGNAVGYGSVVGNYDSSVNIFSAQYSLGF